MAVGFIDRSSPGVGFRANSPDIVSGTETTGAEGIVLRQFTSQGGFVKTVRCLPGVVTVIEEDENDGRNHFRDSLLGKNNPGALDIRSGAQSVHPSEIYIVGSSSVIWEERTLLNVLKVAGVPDARIIPLLEQIGLADGANLPPSELSASALKRLTIASSLFTRSKVLLFDQPFNAIENKWVDPIANIILDATAIPGRIIIVTSAGKIPQVWKGSIRVRVENSGRDIGDRIVGQGRSENDFPFEQVAQSLIRATRAAEERATEVLTRPQMIHSSQARPFYKETVLTEAIVNPNISELPKENPEVLEGVEVSSPANSNGRADVSSPADSSMPKVTRKNKPNTLTKVSGIHRFRHHPFSLAMRQSWKECWSVFDAEASDATVLPAVRLRAEARKQIIRMLIGLLVLALMCGLMFVNV